MNFNLKSFNQFIGAQLNESAQNTEETGFELRVVYDDSVTGGKKETAEEFLKKATSMEASKADSVISGLSAAALSNWQNAWDARNKMRLDEGELRKEGEWYVGKGAWRINANKADFLGMTPKWMSWNDNLQEDILNAFFPDLKGGQMMPAQDELEDVELPAWMTGEEEEERRFAMAEGRSSRLKYVKRILEQEDFHLGPPTEVEGEADVVTPSDLKEVLKMNYKMRHRANVMIWGAPGIGKTQIVKDTAKELEAELGKDIPVIIVTLAQMQPYDLNGIPLLFAKEGGEQFVLPMDQRGQVQMDFAVPCWLPGQGDSEEGILFFDEINRAEQDMLSAALTLLLDRKAQKYTMPSGWRVWAAGNRAMDGPVKPLEAAVATRFLGGHVHLVPTVESWAEWARSDKAFYKDIDGSVTEEWYIPEEFLIFLRSVESNDKADLPKFFDLEDKPIQTEYKYFYKYDKSKLSAGGEGVSVGFPTPRNWSVAFQNIYDTILTDPKIRSQVDPQDDPRRQGIAGFQVALQDAKAANLIERMLKRIVGTTSAKYFMDYIKIFRKHTDNKGTLGEKISNIFKDPSKPRPLIDIPMISKSSERQAILSMIESHIQSMGKSFDMKAFQNWAKYLQDVSDKVKDGELAGHVSGSKSKNPAVADVIKSAMEAFKEFRATGKNREAALAAQGFIEQFRELLGQFDI
jgi:MoxR-like ATPase